jgi:hypothetical protein
MRPLGIIKDEIPGKTPSECLDIMENIEIVQCKFFLYSSVKPFSTSINLWAVGIGKIMGNSLLLQILVKLTEECRPIVCLYRFDRQRVSQFKPPEKVFSIPATQIVITR